MKEVYKASCIFHIHAFILDFRSKFSLVSFYNSARTVSKQANFVKGDPKVCYRERGKGRSLPLPLYLNQQALRLTVKMVGERKSKLSALYALWSVERKKSRSIRWRNSARWWERKIGWLVHRLFAPKRPSRVREIWRRIFSLDRSQR